MEEARADGGDVAWKKYGLMEEIWHGRSMGFWRRSGMEEVMSDGGDRAWKKHGPMEEMWHGRSTACNNRNTRDLATFLRFLFECHTDINCQSAKNYQCCMSSQQTASSYSQLKSIKLCRMSVISNKWSYYLSVVTGPSSLDSSRRRDSILVIVFLACDFPDLGQT